MNSVVFRKKSELELEKTPKPELEDNQVLVEVADVGFCGSDHSIIEKELLPTPIILGHEVSGTVVEVGKSAMDTLVGQRVIIRPTSCGECRVCKMGKTNLCQVDRPSIGIGLLPGGFADYVKAYDYMLIPIPEGVDSQNAALAEVFASAYHGLLTSGSKGGSVLVMGGGPIGLSMVRLLKILGFGPIVLSEPVESKRELGLSWGADLAVNPLQEEIDFFGHPIKKEQGFETVFECSGIKQNIQAAVDAVAWSGTICVVSMMFEAAAFLPSTVCFKEITIMGSIANTHKENQQILEWMAEGKIDARPMVTHTVDLKSLPEAYRDIIATRKAIKMIVNVGNAF